MRLTVYASCDTSTSFNLAITVTGCPDAVPPPKAWYKRNGDTAQIGCEWNDVSWQLQCEGNQWVGQVGNCTARGNLDLNNVNVKKYKFKQ